MENDIEKRHKAIIGEIDTKIKRQETKENKDKKIEKIEEKTIMCPYCNTIITIEYEPPQKIEINCPVCGNKGIATFKDEKKTFDKVVTPLPKNPSFVRSNIINLILITIGAVLLLNPTIPNIKISFTLILIGLILMFILPEEKPSKILKIRTNKTSSLKTHNKTVFKKNNKHIVPLISNTITLALLIWIVFLFFITNDTEIEVFFVLILIGMLIVRELTDELTTVRLKHRIDGFILIFLLAFILMIGEKIINVLNM